MNSLSEIPEFLTAVSDAPDAPSALREGMMRLAEAFDAEVVALVQHGAVAGSVGFPRISDHRRELIDVAAGRTSSLAVPGLGRLDAVGVMLDDQRSALVVARADSALIPEELANARAMGRVLTMTLDLIESVGEQRALRIVAEKQMAVNERLLAQERRHQQMSDAVLRVQRLISQRQPLDEVLHAITEEATSLVDADLAGITIADPEGLRAQALSIGSPTGEALKALLDEDGVAAIGRRAAMGELVEAGFLPAGSTGLPASIAAVGAPVLDNGAPIGGLFLLCGEGATGCEASAENAVQTFASQASIALTDASTLDELRHAFHDPLTGLANRALFLDRLGHALALGRRLGTETALLFIDLDHFKNVNDTLGHAAGDELLRNVGNALGSAGRAYDSAARLGGDEFAILLEDAEERTALAVASRLSRVVAETMEPLGLDGTPSASVGVALTGPGCRDGDELLRRADIAMYSVKARGRAGVAVYTPAMGRTRLDRNTIMSGLQAALERDEFVVHYQPVVALADRSISGVEALVRWLHPERGLVPPVDFIGDAEDTGIIAELGRTVMLSACERIQHWRETIPSAAGLKVNVNLSPRQLETDDIIDEVQQILAETGLDPDALVLEVTESLFMVDAEASGQRLRSLKRLGIQLAIDDFGTGFSSMRYIQTYPFDILKIDRSFVRDLGTSSNGGAVVRTLLSLGRELGMPVIAEGIERRRELEQLHDMSCTHGQGFIFSRPVAAEALEVLLRDGLAGPPAPIDRAAKAL